ncbi:MAG: MBL fold metallo-hydrolase, partial [Treponema sp.]|nr:MBL fold metallo-hydrolase [Treponema sp.]
MAELRKFPGGNWGRYFGFPVFLAVFLLAGACRRSGETVQVRQSQAGETGTGQSAATAPAGDRYDELISTANWAGKFTVFFLDLAVSPEAKDKSGDATLLISPEGKVMMLDSGHPESAGDILSFLSDLGIGRIDYFILSHPHIDHIGGFPAVAERHQVGEAYQIDMEYNTDTYRRYRDALEKRHIPVTNLKRGDTFGFGGEISVEVFNPGEKIEPPGFPADSTQFINNSSLVLKFNYGDSSLLMGGDIYTPRERELIDLYGEKLRADVVKANHHGGDTSNSSRWIRTTGPR